jgi:hypothetical protein
VVEYHLILIRVELCVAKVDDLERGRVHQAWAHTMASIPAYRTAPSRCREQTSLGIRAHVACVLHTVTTPTIHQKRFTETQPKYATKLRVRL